MDESVKKLQDEVEALRQKLQASLSSRPSPEPERIIELPTSPQCPKCHSTMETGWLTDRLSELRTEREEWVEGPPERSFWWGKVTDGKRRYPITSFRCPSCGYLESYAR